MTAAGAEVIIKALDYASYYTAPKVREAATAAYRAGWNAATAAMIRANASRDRQGRK